MVCWVLAEFSLNNGIPRLGFAVVLLDYLGWGSDSNRVCGYAFCYDSIRSDHAAISDAHAHQNADVFADPDPLADGNGCCVKWPGVGVRIWRRAIDAGVVAMARIADEYFRSQKTVVSDRYPFCGRYVNVVSEMTVFPNHETLASIILVAKRFDSAVVTGCKSFSDLDSRFSSQEEWSSDKGCFAVKNFSSDEGIAKF